MLLEGHPRCNCLLTQATVYTVGIVHSEAVHNSRNCLILTALRISRYDIALYKKFATSFG